MAKQTSNRASAEDSGLASPAQPKARRSRGTAGAPPAPEADMIGAQPGVQGSEPSEEDIRLRAYHRYLERGGGHGTDFEDWLEAERELKGGRAEVGSPR